MATSPRRINGREYHVTCGSHEGVEEIVGVYARIEHPDRKVRVCRTGPISLRAEAFVGKEHLNKGGLHSPDRAIPELGRDLEWDVTYNSEEAAADQLADEVFERLRGVPLRPS